MRPPICAICGTDFGPTEGGLVRFAARPSDTQWRERVQRENLVGHPPDTDWFCGEHVAAARASAHLAIDAALAQMRHPQPVSEFTTHPIRPIGPDALAKSLRGLLAALATEPVTTTTAREWTPMDHTEPPYCPYVARQTSMAGGVTLHLDWAHWNETQLARTSAVLTAPTWSLGGHGSGADVTELLTSGELPHEAGELIARLSR